MNAQSLKQIRRTLAEREAFEKEARPWLLGGEWNSESAAVAWDFMTDALAEQLGSWAYAENTCETVKSWFDESDFDWWEFEFGEGSTFIYAIECLSSGRVKVGKSDNPSKRLRDISRHLPEGGRLLGVLEVPDAINGWTPDIYFHKICLFHRRSNLEWYERDSVVFDALRGCGMPGLDGLGSDATRAEPDD